MKSVTKSFFQHIGYLLEIVNENRCKVAHNKIKQVRNSLEHCQSRLISNFEIVVSAYSLSGSKPALFPQRSSSTASTRLGPRLDRMSVIVCPTDEKSRSDWAELADMQRTRRAVADRIGYSLALYFQDMNGLLCPNGAEVRPALYAVSSSSHVRVSAGTEAAAPPSRNASKGSASARHCFFGGCGSSSDFIHFASFPILFTFSHISNPSRLKITDRSFYCTAPALWNSLPSDSRIRSPSSTISTTSVSLFALSTSQFVSRLETHMFHQSFPPYLLSFPLELIHW